MSKPTNVDNPGASSMKAVIFSDNDTFAAMAEAVLCRVGSRSHVRVVWDVRCWPLNCLSDAALGGVALAESRDAHLIVLPAIQARSISMALLAWLTRWAAQRHVRDAALGFIAEGKAAEIALPVAPDLALFAGQHGLKLLIGGGLASRKGSGPGAFPSPKRPRAGSLGQSGFQPAGATCSYQSFGIND